MANQRVVLERLIQSHKVESYDDYLKLKNNLQNRLINKLFRHHTENYWFVKQRMAVPYQLDIVVSRNQNKRKTRKSTVLV